MAESFVRNVRHEVLDKMLLFSEKQIRYVLSSYLEHYHTERPHKGLDNRRIIEPEEPAPTEGPVLCRERLGGLLKTYYRKAA